MVRSILNIICAYNEIDYLPYVIKDYEQKGIPVFVFDNYSKDGTWEWLKEHNIPCQRIDTKGRFDLRVLQKMKTEKFKEINPDWGIYGDADEFIETETPLRQLIEYADQKGYNSIELIHRDLCNTGEKRGGDPRDVFFYYKLKPRYIARIFKLKDFIKFTADIIRLKNRKTKRIVNGYNLDFGGTNKRENRFDTFERRKLAWEHGLSRAWGIHYIWGMKRNFLWDKRDLRDVRNVKIYRDIKLIIK